MEAALGAAVVLLFASPARSQPSGECLWAGVPEATKARIYDAYARGGHVAAADAEDLMDVRVAVACTGIVPDTPEQAQRLAEAVTLLGLVTTTQEASRKYLNARGYSDAALDRAWAQLSPKARDKVEALSDALERDPGDERSLRALTNLVRYAAELAGRPSRQSADEEPTIERFLDYFGSRATRERIEGGASPPPFGRRSPSASELTPSLPH